VFRFELCWFGPCRQVVPDSGAFWIKYRWRSTNALWSAGLGVSHVLQDFCYPYAGSGIHGDQGSSTYIWTSLALSNVGCGGNIPKEEIWYSADHNPHVTDILYCPASGGTWEIYLDGVPRHRRTGILFANQSANQALFLFGDPTTTAWSGWWLDLYIDYFEIRSGPASLCSIATPTPTFTPTRTPTATPTRTPTPTATPIIRPTPAVTPGGLGTYDRDAAALGSDLQWVVNKDLHLALGAWAPPTPPAIANEVLTYTYRGVTYTWPTPVPYINRERSWTRPMIDTIPYRVRIRTTYADLSTAEWEFDLTIQATINYLRRIDLPR